eukprot:766673-Hanusia_phi.AAC.2
MSHMDAARDDLVKRIMNVEKVVTPQAKKTAIKSSLVSSPTAPQQSTGFKNLVNRILSPSSAGAKNDQFSHLNKLIYQQAWGQLKQQGDLQGNASQPLDLNISSLMPDGNSTDSLDSDILRDLKALVHRHLRSVEAGIEAARTTRDAADAAEHALGYTQHIAGEVGDIAGQAEKDADRIVEAAKLTAEARDAMRAALQQSSQIVDYNTHAAKAVAQDAGFVTTASQAVARYLNNIFHDQKAVRKASAAVMREMHYDETNAHSAAARIRKEEAELKKNVKQSRHAAEMAAQWEARAHEEAERAESASSGAMKGEQRSLQAGILSLRYARYAREFAGYAGGFGGGDVVRGDTGEEEDCVG